MGARILRAELHQKLTSIISVAFEQRGLRAKERLLQYWRCYFEKEGRHNRGIAPIGAISRVVCLRALMYVCMICSENCLQKNACVR